MRANLRRNVQVSQRELGRIEWRAEIEVLHAHEQPQRGITGKRGGEARIVIAGRCERANSAARKIKHSVGVAIEGQLIPQVGFIRGMKARGAPALIEVDRRGWRDQSRTPATAPPT